MHKFLQQVWGVIFRPRSTLTEIGRNPRVKPVLLLLFLMSVSQTLRLDEFLKETGDDGRWFIALVLAVVAFSFVLAFGFEAIAAVLTVLTARVVRFSIEWRGVFCLCCFAGIPSWVIAFVSVPLSELSWEGRWIGLALDSIGLFWSLVLTFLGLRLLPGSSVRNAFAALMPSIVIWGSLMLYVASTEGPTLQNAERWQRADGELVQLYTPREHPATSVSTEKCDSAVRWVCNFWQVAPPERRIKLYLFSSEESHQRFAQDETTAASAVPSRLCVSLVGGEWDSVAGTVAHEFSHVIVHHRIARDLPALLDEGMAEMCEREFARVANSDEDTVSPVGSPRVPLLDLADSGIFYDTEIDTLWRHYGQAHAFVRDLVAQYGLPKFKRLCRVISERRTKEWILGDERAQFAEAFEATFGVSLTDWEQNWQAKSAANAKPEGR